MFVDLAVSLSCFVIASISSVAVIQREVCTPTVRATQNIYSGEAA